MHRPVAAELASSKTSDACAARSEVISRSGHTTRHSWVRLPYVPPCRALSCQSAPQPVTYHGCTRLPCFRKRDVFLLRPLRCSSGCSNVCPQWSASSSRITGGCPRRSISCRLPRSSCKACSPTGNSTVGNKKRVPTTIERSVSEINRDLLHWGAQAAVLRHYGREHPPPLAVVQGQGRVAVENIVNRGPDELTMPSPEASTGSSVQIPSVLPGNSGRGELHATTVRARDPSRASPTCCRPGPGSFGCT